MSAPSKHRLLQLYTQLTSEGATAEAEVLAEAYWSRFGEQPIADMQAQKMAHWGGPSSSNGAPAAAGRSRAGTPASISTLPTSALSAAAASLALPTPGTPAGSSALPSAELSIGGSSLAAALTSGNTSSVITALAGGQVQGRRLRALTGGSAASGSAVSEPGPLPVDSVLMQELALPAALPASAPCAEPELHPPAQHMAVKWEQAKGQAAPERGRDGYGTKYSFIKSAPLAQLVQQLAFTVATCDIEHTAPFTSAGALVVCNLQGDDLLLPDCICACLPAALAAPAAAAQCTPVQLWLATLRAVFDAEAQAGHGEAGVVTLALLHFWLSRHALRLQPDQQREAWKGGRDLAVHVHAWAAADWELPASVLGASGVAGATRRGLLDVARTLQRMAPLLGRAPCTDAASGQPSWGLRSLGSPGVPGQAPDLSALPRELQGAVLAHGSIDLALALGAWICIPPAVLAAAWTLADAALFRAIPLWELLEAGWDDPRYAHSADAVYRCVDRYQAVSLWVATCVVRARHCGTAPDFDSADGLATDRAAMVRRMLALAKEFKRLRNFSAMSAVLTGLRLRDLPSVLWRTWETLPPEASDLIDSLSSLVDSTRQYELYNVATESIALGSAVVPHLAAHTSALTLYLGSHVPDTLAGAAARDAPVLHVNKWRSVWERQLARLLHWQAQSYTEQELGMPAHQLRAVQHCVHTMLRPHYFQFDDDRDAAIQDALAIAAAMEPPPPPPPVISEDGEWEP